MDTPLVSICIPTYNGSRFVQAALESAVRQDYPNLEIVISDDQSTDGTLESAKDYLSQSRLPFFIHTHKRSTIGANWNNCVQHAHGAYIKFLFQDDTLDPDCVSQMMHAALQNPNIGLVFCRRRFIYEHLDEQKEKWLSTYRHVHKSWSSLKPIQPGRQLLKDPGLLQIPRNKIGEPPVVLLNKNVFDKVGYFSTALHQALDYEFWYRVCTQFDVAFVDKELVSFRLHDQQATIVNSKRFIGDYELYPKLMYKKYFSYLHRDVKKSLFLRYNTIGKLMVRTSNVWKRLLRSS